ncbi:MAG: DUF1015 family protein [Candidatus Nanopelagicales bacterium]
MVHVHPFRALRPPADRAAAVSAPPYDVLSVAEARALAAGNPDSILRVTRPEVGLAAGTDEHSDEAYAQGAIALRDLVDRGVLVADDVPAYYAYRQVMGPVTQTGLVACVSVDDYAQGRIRRHEHTRPDKEEDRTRHILALGAHDEPVFLLSPRVPAVEDVLARVTATEPEYDFVAGDGVRHTLWVVADGDDVAALTRAFGAVEALYVADGHHRSAAAQRARDALRPATATAAAADLSAAGPDGPEYERFLAVVFAEDQLHVMPYNRVVADLNGLDADGLLAALTASFDVSASPDPVEPGQRHEFGVYVAGRWHRLRARDGVMDESDPRARLDVSILQERVLGPMLGIDDPRTDRRIAFVGGIRGTAELERLVDTGQAAVAFSLHPTSVEDLMALADRGEVMPPKSTWFEPKLRSGLFLHPFAD